MLLGSLTINSACLSPIKLYFCSADVGSKSTKVGMILTTQEIFIVLYNCLENCNLSEPECFQVRGERDRQQQGGMKRLGQERDWGVRGNGGMRFVRNFSLSQLSRVLTIKSRGNTLLNKWRCLIAASAAWASSTCHLSLVAFKWQIFFGSLFPKGRRYKRRRIFYSQADQKSLYVQKEHIYDKIIYLLLKEKCWRKRASKAKYSETKNR